MVGRKRLKTENSCSLPPPQPLFNICSKEPGQNLRLGTSKPFVCCSAAELPVLLFLSGGEQQLRPQVFHTATCRQTVEHVHLSLDRSRPQKLFDNLAFGLKPGE